MSSYIVVDKAISWSCERMCSKAFSEMLSLRCVIVIICMYSVYFISTKVSLIQSLMSKEIESYPDSPINIYRKLLGTYVYTWIWTGRDSL